jgi:membrane fusion protein (multidrug efflux system)
MRVRFSITENDYLKFSQEMTGRTEELEVQFLLNDGLFSLKQVKLDFANREIDPTTGSLLCRHCRKQDELLRPGQYVKVRFKSAEIQMQIWFPNRRLTRCRVSTWLLW